MNTQRSANVTRQTRPHCDKIRHITGRSSLFKPEAISTVSDRQDSITTWIYKLRAADAAQHLWGNDFFRMWPPILKAAKPREQRTTKFADS